MGQWYCYLNGQKYGPVSVEELQSWIRDNRVSPTDHVWTEGMENWVQAKTIPNLCFTTPPPAPVAAQDDLSQLAGVVDGQDPNPTYPNLPPPTVTYGQPTKKYLKPHRGGIILVFGILSWVCCIIFGIMAWVMGSSDLREMRNGIMDRSGEPITYAGYLLGMIGTIVGIIAIPILVFSKASHF